MCLTTVPALRAQPLCPLILIFVARFSLELPATTVFDYPSAAALARFLALQLPANSAMVANACDSDNLDAASEADWWTDASPYDVWELGSALGVKEPELLTDLVSAACLYPGHAAASLSGGLSGFWAAAAAGASLQAPVPPQRWDLDWCYSAEAAPGCSYARFAAWTEDVDLFDAAAFRYN